MEREARIDFPVKRDIFRNVVIILDLPEKYRAPVHLFYHEGYSTRQIAEILQRGEATVRSELHRGRALLREILKEAYDFDEIR